MRLFLQLVHRDGMLQLRALILLVKVALVIEYILVLMFLHEVIYPLAFELTLVYESFLTLLLLVHLSLEQQTMGQAVLL